MEDEILESKEEAAERQAVRDALPAMVHVIQSRFTTARNARRVHESRWTNAYNDYRGVYTDGDGEDGTQSRVFIKIAKTKTLAAYGQTVEVVFPSNKNVPIEVFATEKPMGIAKYAHLSTPKGPDAQEEGILPEFDVGFIGDDVLGGAASKFPDGDWEAGPADAGKPEIEPAKIAANNMNLTIQDQLTEGDAARKVRAALFECALYGTGIVKGPLTKQVEIAQWDFEEGKEDDEGEMQMPTSTYKPKMVTVPDITSVSVWNFFPDPGGSDVDGLEWGIERHKYSGSDLRALKNRPFFLNEAIAKAIDNGPNYLAQDQELYASDDQTSSSSENRWEVLEYWGILDVRLAKEIGIELDDDVSQLEEAQFNVWLCGDEILRVVVNPFKPTRLPWHIFPFEFNPNSIWGIGIPENMSDTTAVMNGNVRLAIENLALSGSVMLDVNKSILEDGQDLSISPGKTFYSNGQAGQRAINAIEIPNQTQKHFEMFDRMRQIADEETGMPSYSHGQTGVNSQTRTASGMSMLMGAASLTIKTTIKNVDDFLLKPLGQALFYWNMQFNPDPSIRGDLSIKALGTEAMMQKEVMSQRLTQFLQIAANPTVAPKVNIGYIIEEIAVALDIDPTRAVNSDEEAKIQAEIFNIANGGPPAGAEGAPGAQGAPQQGQGGKPPPQQGETGNGDGTVGTGKVPMPGEPEFSGNVS